MRIRHQRRFDERLRQRKAHLAQVFRIRPQHDDFRGRHARRDDQAIEIVVLHFAAEDAPEGVFEHRVQPVNVGVRVGRRRLHAEVVEPDRRLVRRRHAMRPLVQHPESHALQHRQAVGQRHRTAQVEKLEAQRARLRLQRSIQAHAQRLADGEACHHLDVGHRRASGEILAIGPRQRPGEPAEELVAARLSQRVDQRVLEVIVPAPRGKREPGFQVVGVEGGNGARRRAHGDHHASQDRFRNMDVELGARAVEGVAQDRLPLLAQFGRVVLARGVNEANEKTLEGIAPHEQTEALPLAEMQNAHRRAQQLVLARLEQLVARIARENVEQRLAGVAAGGDARPGDDVGRLPAQERNVRRIRAVRGRRVQAEEAMLAADVAGGVEALDADVVEIARAVHGRAGVGLRDDQEVGNARVRPDLRRQCREAGRDLPRRVLTQEAEAGAGDDLQRVVAVRPRPDRGSGRRGA